MSFTFNKLSKKAKNRVRNAMEITKRYQTGEKNNTQFSMGNKGVIKFKAYDKLTKLNYAGSFSFDKKGVVTEYAVYGTSNKNSDTLFYSVKLKGKNGFKHHNQSRYRTALNGEFEKALDGLYDDYAVARAMADFLDELPGADKNDLFSTGVSVNGSDYAFA